MKKTFFLFYQRLPYQVFLPLSLIYEKKYFPFLWNYNSPFYHPYIEMKNIFGKWKKDLQLFWGVFFSIYIWIGRKRFHTTSKPIKPILSRFVFQKVYVKNMDSELEKGVFLEIFFICYRTAITRIFLKRNKEE